mgnify:CR=1 FL=1
MSFKTSDSFSYPYPVLGCGQSVQGDPVVKQTELSQEIGARQGCYSYKLEFCIGNQEIEELVSSGQADCITEVYCIDSPYRKCFHAHRGCTTVMEHIPQTEVLGRIVVRNLVVASVLIVNYTNKKAAEWFKGHSFNVERGEPLAVLPELQFDTKLQVASQMPISSWMTVKSTAKDRMFVSVLSDKVCINLPEKAYQQFTSAKVVAKKENEIIIVSSLALPAVIYALKQYQKHEDAEFVWVKAVHAIFEQDEYQNFDLENITDDDALQAAQMILHDPVTKLIDQLKLMGDMACVGADKSEVE